jgi:Zn finger protein HypA/HybF involved in hydrogenase expression
MKADLTCYRCLENLPMALVALYPYERKVYYQANIVIRKCPNCGLEQNHVGDGEPLSAESASEIAPSPTD